MPIESQIQIGHDCMLNIPQANFKSARLLNKLPFFNLKRTVLYVGLRVLIGEI